MLIHSIQQLRVIPDRALSVSLNSEEIEQVTQAKVLGVTLDSHLTWTNHIDNLCSTINSRLALLRRIKPFLTKDCALRFYNSCIHANIIYCSVTWGNCSKTLLQIILCLQKRAARIILDADYSTPSVLLFSQLKFIPIFYLIKFRKLLLLLNILINPNTPPSFKLMFNLLSATRQHARTRACLYDLLKDNSSQSIYFGCLYELKHVESEYNDKKLNGNLFFFLSKHCEVFFKNPCSVGGLALVCS